MHCAFLLGSPHISGGTYVIFEHAVRMQRAGVQIHIITEEKVEPEHVAWHKDAKELHFITYTQAKDYKFDIVLATWWRTVYELYRVEADRYAYFVQSIETRFYPESEKNLRRLVETTYLLGLPVVTEATWIQEYLRDYGQIAYLVKNGLRKDLYQKEGKVCAPREVGKLRILVEGPLGVFFKNTEKAIALAKRSNADEVWLLTSSAIQSYAGVDRLFSRVPMAETSSIYRSCDVLLKLSYVEGMFGPPLEIFGCGGTAIVYNVTGHDEYIRSGENALVLNRDDEVGVVAAINQLKRDADLLQSLKNEALKTAEKWPDWNTQAGNFQSALTTILTDCKPNTVAIKKKTQFFFDSYVEAENNIKLIQEKILKKLRKYPWIINPLRWIYNRRRY